MPSYTIHLAAAKRYLEYNAEDDPAAFLRGVLAPDLQKKPESHYGPQSSSPGLEVYKKEVGLDDSYKRGYYFHLLTDYYFYNEFLTEFSKEIYNDYDKLNRAIIERYGIEVPEYVRDTVAFKDGEPKLLSKNRVFSFIDRIGAMSLTDYRWGDPGVL
ncbi:MAG: hypothetical protein E7647_08480 [Ruminococcaceae bacterium]|nr:hypothetical protein [Oscillospiraceae bacterium]